MQTSQLVAGRRQLVQVHTSARQAVRHCSSRPSFRSHASTTSSQQSTCETCPSPSETARTVVDLSSEGTLSTVTSQGMPLGTPVAYTLDKDGQPVMHINAGSLQAAHLAADNRCSLLVQPITYPARGVASVALQGTAQQQEGQAGDYKLNVEQCVYFGGLDHQVRTATFGIHCHPSVQFGVVFKSAPNCLVCQ